MVSAQHHILKIDPKQIKLEDIEQVVDCLVSRKPQTLWQNQYQVPADKYPELQLQSDNYLNGHEKNVPSDVLEKLEWLVRNNISFKLFRKPITQNCEDAIKATQEVFENCADEFKQKVSLDEEVKQMVLLVKKNNSGSNPIVTAVNIRASHRLVGSYEKSGINEAEFLDFFNADIKNQNKEILKYNSDKKADLKKRLIPEYKKIVMATNFVHGRNDPPTFHLNKDVIPQMLDVQKEQLISDELLNNEKSFFNLGNGTWRVELSKLDFLNMIKAITREAAEDKNYKVSVVNGVTAEEVKTPETKLNIVTTQTPTGCEYLGFVNK